MRALDELGVQLGRAALPHRKCGCAAPYDGPVTSPGYLRFPHIANDLVAFVAADDVWLAPVSGGRAWRFTTDQAEAATPRLSSNGRHLAWASTRDGSPEVYVASVADGISTRLTYWGTSWARVSGWTPAGEVLAVSPANQPFRDYIRARALTTALSGVPGAERVLPLGLVADLSLGASGNAAGGDGSRPDTLGLLTGTWGTGRPTGSATEAARPDACGSARRRR